MGSRVDLRSAIIVLIFAFVNGLLGSRLFCLVPAATKALLCLGEGETGAGKRGGLIKVSLGG